MALHLVLPQPHEEMEYRAKNPGCVRMYDVATDGFRDVTQHDVDLLLRAAGNWAATREAIEQLSFVTVELHKKYMNALKGEE